MKNSLKQLIVFIICAPVFLCAEKADLIIFSYDRPMQLWALLESIEKNVTNIGDVYVVYRTSADEFTCAYEEVKKTFDTISYIQQSNDPRGDFKRITIECVRNCRNDHIFFAVDDIVVTRPIDLNECIQVMEETQTYGFYMRLGLNLTACYPMKAAQKIPHGAVHKDNFFIWQFKNGEHDWGYPHTVDMTIFRKIDVRRQLHGLTFNSPNTLEAQWAKFAGHTRSKRGVCYVQTHIVNIPLNRVQHDYGNRNMDSLSAHDMLSLFSAGFKIDIGPLHGCINESAHMEYTPMLVPRQEAE